MLRSIQSSSALISWPCGSWRHSQLQLLNGFLGEGLLLIEEYFWINIVDEGKLANCIDQLISRFLGSIDATPFASRLIKLLRGPIVVENFQGVYRAEPQSIVALHYECIRAR